MSDIATSFYQLHQNPATTDEERWEATVAFRDNPENLASCFSFLVTPTNSLASKKFIALSMRIILNKFWVQLRENQELVESFKQMSFDSIKNTTDVSLAEIIIYSIELIIRYEVASWPEYFELISQYVESQQPNLLLIAMEMINNAVEFMVPAEYEQNYEFIHEIISSQLQSGSAPHILKACKLLNRCVHVPGTNLEVFADLVQGFAELYVQSLPAYSAIFKDLSYTISEILKTDNLPVDPMELYGSFSGVFSNEALTSDYFPFAFSPLCNIVSKYPDSFVEQVPDLFKLIFESSVQILQEKGCEESFEQNPASYITYNIGFIADVPDYEMFNEMKELLDSVEEQTAETVIVGCLMYNEVIDILVEDAASYNPTIINTMIQYLSMDNAAVQEAAMNVLSACASKLETSQIDLSDLIIQNVIPFITAEAEGFINVTLQTVENVLESSTISTSFIQPLAEALYALIQESSDLCGKIIGILSDLISTTNGDATQIITDFFEVAEQLAQEDDPGKLHEKGIALEFFANVITNPHEGVEEEQIGQILQLVLENAIASVALEDKSLHLSIIMVFQNLIKAKLEVLGEVKDKIIEMVDMLFDSCSIINMSEDSPDMSLSSDDMNIVANLFILIQTIFTEYPELLPDVLDKWFNFAITYGSLPFDDVSLEALITCKSMLRHVIKNEIDPTPFIEHLASIFTEGSPSLTAENLSIIGDLVKEEIALPEELIQTAAANAGELLIGKHRVQTEEFDDDNIEEIWNNSCYKKLFEFYDALYEKGIDAIEPLKFIEVFTEFEKLNESDKEPIAYFINSLVKLYIKGKTVADSIPPIGLGRIIEIVRSHIEMCDFTVPPTPLIGARTILLNDPAVFAEDGSIFEGIGEILQSEYSGELYYWNTIMSAISFICTCTVVSQGFDVSPFIESILNHLPVKGDLSTAEGIYSALLRTITTEAGEIYQQLAKVVALTLGYHDKVLQSMGITPATLSAMKACVMAIPETETFLGEVFSEDQISLQRCVSRLQ